MSNDLPEEGTVEDNAITIETGTGFTELLGTDGSDDDQTTDSVEEVTQAADEALEDDDDALAELIDEEEEPIVVAGVLIEPARGRGHRPRAGEVGLVAEVPARVIVRDVAPSEARRAYPARVRPRPPAISFVSPLVLPRGEVGVVVLASGRE